MSHHIESLEELQERAAKNIQRCKVEIFLLQEIHGALLTEKRILRNKTRERLNLVLDKALDDTAKTLLGASKFDRASCTLVVGYSGQEEFKAWGPHDANIWLNYDGSADNLRAVVLESLKEKEQALPCYGLKRDALIATGGTLDRARAMVSNAMTLLVEDVDLVNIADYPEYDAERLLKTLISDIAEARRSKRRGY